MTIAQLAPAPHLGAPGFTLLPFDPASTPAVSALHATVFGPGRFARTAFRLRERARPLPDLSFLAFDGPVVVGSVSMSRITVGTTHGTLLGPLAVLSPVRDRGIGRALLAKAVERAFVTGEPYVLLVGDAPYYAPFGFERVPPASMLMPGPVDPARLLIACNPKAGERWPSGVVAGVDS